MKRAFDVALALAAAAALAPPMLLIAALVRLTSPGPALHWSLRIGARGSRFWMPKFRTMRLGAPDVATHLLGDPGRYVTPLGRLLRVLSLDELPQLLNILRGEMSFVGPRPALHNQDDLAALRERRGVDALTPGLTGWAQINGRDDLPIPAKVDLDAEYLRRRSFWFDLRILLLTPFKVLRGEGVQH